MKITVRFDSDALRFALVKFTPGWLARLLGAEPKERLALRATTFTRHQIWTWAASGRLISRERNGARIIAALEREALTTLTAMEKSVARGSPPH